jgi:hypothetical protein
MAAELRHRIQLEELQKKGRVEPKMLSEEIIMEDLQDPGRPQQITPGSSLHDIWKRALQKEQHAAQQYFQISRETSFGLVRQVFHLLFQEELRHVRWVKKQLEQDV